MMSLEEVEIRFLESGLKYEANGDVIAESIVSGYHSLICAWRCQREDVSCWKKAPRDKIVGEGDFLGYTNNVKLNYQWR